MTPVDPRLLETLTTSLAAQPENLSLRIHLVDLLVEADRTDDALRTIKAGTENDRQDLEFRRRVVMLLRRTGAVAEALIRAEPWVEETGDPTLRCELARALLARGSRPEALEQYRQALEEDSGVRDPQFDDLVATFGDDRQTTLPDILDREDGNGIQEEDEDEDRELWDPATGEREELDEQGISELHEWETELVTFADVAGLEEVKRQINLRIISPFLKEDIYKAFGRKAGGGVLLYGPPGCGKTYIARATAGEIGAAFINVGINEVLDKYYGESNKIIHSLFQDARRRAPTVLFFDEFDALGASRGRSESQFYRTLVTQLLQEMDGLHGRPANVLTIAATNLPWNVDPAFRRPGRFDRVLFVPTPDTDARLKMMADRTASLPGGNVLDLKSLAKRTEGMSGADLNALCERAAERSLEASIESGEVVPISEADFEKALTMTDATSEEWFATARNYARYSNTAGQYDDLTAFLRKTGRM